MRSTTMTLTTWVAGMAVLAACGQDDGRGQDDTLTGINVTASASATDGATGDTGNQDHGDDGTNGTHGGSGAADSGSADSDDTGDGPKFDLGVPPDGGTPPDCEELGNCECTIPEHVPCDAGTNDPFLAMGLNCPGELQVVTSTSGPASARGIRSSFGSTNVYDPREGTVYAVLGSGIVSELDSATPAFDGLLAHADPTYCNDDLGAYDPGGSLPAPLSIQDVGGDCTANPALLGTGDCSNTIEDQFSQGGQAEDYVEMRFSVQVPPDVVSFSYDFAFSSTEYPFYYGSPYNDMYVGWLESEQWTGNISFDAAGNPISLNAGFLEFTDNDPELSGTCMQAHAATGWLTTTTGVTPNEMITVVFAIFDLSDSNLDSYVFLDDFQWGCEPTGGPVTEPEG